MNTFWKWIKKVSDLGIKEDTVYIEELKIRMLNQQTLIVCLLNLFFAIRDISDPASPVIATAVFLLTVIVFYLNAKEHYLAARFYWTCFYPFLMIAVSYFYGIELRIEYVFIHYILTIFIFFERIWLQVALICFVFLMYGISIYIYENFESPYSSEVEVYDKALIFLTALFCTANIIYVVFQGLKRRLVEISINEKELQAKNEELERFAFIASHDLKEPLGNIINFSGLLKNEISKQKDSEQNKYIGIIDSNAQQMNQLIIDTLEYASNSESHLEKEWVDSNEIIEDIQSLLQDLIRKKSVSIIIDNMLPPIYFKKHEATMIFKNLIENGIKYNVNKPIIKINFQESKTQYIFSVTDNGKGIAKEYHQDIFIMYKRLEDKTVSGTGLGLATCKRILDRFEEKIWVEASNLQGTTFCFSIKKKLRNKEIGGFPIIDKLS